MSPKENQKSASDFDALDATGCGTQRPLCALSGTRVQLTAAPTAPPCFRRRRRSSPLQERGCSPLSDPKEEVEAQKMPAASLNAFLCFSNLLLRSRCYVISFRNDFFFARHPEQHESHDEQHDEGADTHIGAAGELASHADDHGAKEGRALAADVEEAKVFARLFRRDDLCKCDSEGSLYC